MSIIDSQLRQGEHVINKTEASMQFYEAPQSYPGFIVLTNQRIFWVASGGLHGYEVDNSFELEAISKVKCGTIIISYRIVVYMKDGDNIIFNQVDKAKAKAFVEAYHQLTN